MYFYIYMKGALTKMVNALIPRQKEKKSVFVSQKYDSSRTFMKRKGPLRGKSVLCTEKYFQSEGVDAGEESSKETE